MIEKTLSTISALPSNAEQFESFVNKMKAEIVSGDQDLLVVLRNLKFMEKVVDNVLKDEYVKDAILSEADSYGQKEFDHASVKFSIRETGTRYDLSTCGDPVIDDLMDQEKKIKKSISERSTFLKALPDEGAFDVGTGLHIQKPTKKSTTSVAVTLGAK